MTKKRKKEARKKEEEEEREETREKGRKKRKKKKKKKFTLCGPLNRCENKRKILTHNMNMMSGWRWLKQSSYGHAGAPWLQPVPFQIGTGMILSVSVL